MGRYSVAGSGLDCKSSGFTSPGSSPGRLTTVPRVAAASGAQTTRPSFYRDIAQFW